MVAKALAFLVFVNAAVAANVLSDGAVAYADATQSAPIDQGNLTGGGN